MKDTQTQGPDSVPNPSSLGEGVVDDANSKIETREIKAMVSKKIFVHNTMYFLIVLINYFIVCFARHF